MGKLFKGPLCGRFAPLSRQGSWEVRVAKQCARRRMTALARYRAERARAEARRRAAARDRALAVMADALLLTMFLCVCILIATGVRP